MYITDFLNQSCETLRRASCRPQLKQIVDLRDVDKSGNLTITEFINNDNDNDIDNYHSRVKASHHAGDDLRMGYRPGEKEGGENHEIRTTPLGIKAEVSSCRRRLSPQYERQSKLGCPIEKTRKMPVSQFRRSYQNLKDSAKVAKTFCRTLVFAFSFLVNFCLLPFLLFCFLFRALEVDSLKTKPLNVLCNSFSFSST